MNTEPTIHALDLKLTCIPHDSRPSYIERYQEPSVFYDAFLSKNPPTNERIFHYFTKMPMTHLYRIEGTHTHPKPLLGMYFRGVHAFPILSINALHSITPYDRQRIVLILAKELFAHTDEEYVCTLVDQKDVASMDSLLEDIGFDRLHDMEKSCGPSAYYRLQREVFEIYFPEGDIFIPEPQK